MTRAPIRRRPALCKKARRKRLGWKGKLGLGGAALVLGVLGWAALARKFAPVSQGDLTRFDAIIVLGSPANSDGNPTPAQLARVTEAVHEYKRGVAPRLILSGGAVRNRFVEAQVMAQTAEAQGIPESAIVIEARARDTIENACYAARAMKAHDWYSAEIVTGAAQAPRAGIIFKGTALQWKLHEAPPLEPAPAAYESLVSAVELLKTARYLVWARWIEHCEP